MKEHCAECLFTGGCVLLKQSSIIRQMIMCNGAIELATVKTVYRAWGCGCPDGRNPVPEYQPGTYGNKQYDEDCNRRIGRI